MYMLVYFDDIGDSFNKQIEEVLTITYMIVTWKGLLWDGSEVVDAISFVFTKI